MCEEKENKDEIKKWRNVANMKLSSKENIRIMKGTEEYGDID